MNRFRYILFLVWLVSQLAQSRHLQQQYVSICDALANICNDDYVFDVDSDSIISRRTKLNPYNGNGTNSSNTSRLSRNSYFGEKMKLDVIIRQLKTFCNNHSSRVATWISPTTSSSLSPSSESSVSASESLVAESSLPLCSSTLSSSMLGSSSSLMPLTFCCKRAVKYHRRNHQRRLRETLPISLRLPDSSTTDQMHVPENTGIPSIINITLKGTNIEMYGVQRNEMYSRLDVISTFVTRVPSSASKQRTVEITYEDDILNVTYILPNVTATMPFFQNVSSNIFDLVQRGALDADEVVPCLLSDVYDVENPTVLVTVEDINLDYSSLSLPGSMDSSMAANMLLNQVDSFGLYVTTTSIRNLLHSEVTSYISGISVCPPLIDGDIFIDFRDFFLPPEEAKELGGSGDQPYGALGSVLYTNAIQDKFQPAEDEMVNATIDTSFHSGTLVKLNNILTDLTPEQSGTIDLDANEEVGEFLGCSVRIHNARIENINTIVSPSFLLKPTGSPYTLSNYIKVGDESTLGKDFKFGFSVTFDGSPTGTNASVTNTIDLVFAVESAHILYDTVAMILTPEFLSMPLKETLSLSCWLALVSESYQDLDGNRISDDRKFGIEHFMIILEEFSLGFMCTSCTTTTLNGTLSQLIDIFEESEVTSVVENRLELLIAESVLSRWYEEPVDEVIFQQRAICEEHIRNNFTDSMTPSTFPQFDGFPEDVSLDSLFFFSLVTGQTFSLAWADMIQDEPDLGAARKLFLPFVQGMLTEEPTEEDMPTIEERSQSQNKSSSPLVDWAVVTDTSIGNVLLDWTRTFLETYDNTTGDQRVHSLAKEFLLLGDDDAFDWLTFKQDMKFEYNNIEFRLNRLRIEGFDKMVYHEILNVTSPQTIANKVNLQRLNITFFVSADHLSLNSEPRQDVKISFEFGDLNVSLPLHIAVEEKVLDELKLGSFLIVAEILDCLFSYINITVPELPVSLGGGVQIAVEGLQADTQRAISKSFDLILATFPSKIKEVAAYAFNTLGVAFLSELLNANQKKNSTKCYESDLENVPLYVDLRELLLSDEGIYGDLFYSLKQSLDKDVAALDLSTGTPKINNFFQKPILEDEELEAGTFFHEDPFVSLNFTISKGYFRCELYGFMLEHLDTVGAPLVLLQPDTGSEYLLRNLMTIGVGPNATRMSWGTALDAGERTIGQFYNDFEISIDVSYLSMYLLQYTKVRADLLFNLPLSSLFTDKCIALLLTTVEGPGIEQASGIEDMEISFNDAALDFKCFNCTNIFLLYFGTVLEKLDYEFEVLFSRLFNLVVQQIEAYLNTGMYDRDIYLMAKECPLEVEGFNKTLELPPEIPDFAPVSPESVETLAFTGFVVLQVLLHVFVIEHIKFAGIKSDPFYTQENYVVPPNISLVDFTTISGPLTKVVNRFLSYISSPVTDPMTGEIIDIVNNQIVRKLFTDDYRPFKVDELFESPVWSAELTGVYITGLETAYRMELFEPIGPQTLQCKLAFNRVVFKMDVVAKSDGYSASSYYKDRQGSIVEGESSVPFAISLVFENIDISASIFFAVDLFKVKEINLGAFLNSTDYCILYATQLFNMTEFFVSASKIDNIVEVGDIAVDEFQSDEIRDATETLRNVLTEEYGDLMAAAAPYLFDNTIRKLINDYLSPDQSHVCVYNNAMMGSSEGRSVDLRDLFHSDSTSRYFGGSGLLPYGPNVYRALLVLDVILENDPYTGVSGINTYIFGPEDNRPGLSEAGHFHFSGDLLSMQTSFEYKELNAFAKLNVTDLSILNLNTIGDPLSLLEVANSPYQVNNTITFGVGKPLHFSGRIQLELRLGDQHISNDFDISFFLHSVTMVLDGFMKIDEQAFIDFPLTYANEVFCWLTLFPPSNVTSSGDVSRNAGLTRLGMMIGKASMNASCRESCTSPYLGGESREYQSPPDVSDQLTDHLNKIFHYLTSRLSGEFSQQFIDQAIRQGPKHCPFHQDFVGKSKSGFSAKEFVKNNFKPIPSYVPHLDTAHRISADHQVLGFVYAVISLLVVFLALYFALRRKVRRQYEIWLETASPEELLDLRYQQAFRRKRDVEVNKMTESMYHSASVIPEYIRLAVPVVLFVTIVLFLVGHVCNGVEIHLFLEFMGEPIFEKNIFTITGWQAPMDIWIGGNRFIAIMAFFSSSALPYLRQLTTLLLWFVPPKYIPIYIRGSIFFWLDLLAKWSILGIMTLIVFVVGSRPQINLLPATIFSADLLMVPSVGLYSNLGAQLISQIMSRVIIRYHNEIISQAELAFEQRNNLRLTTSTTSASSKDTRETEEMQSFESESHEEHVGSAVRYGEAAEKNDVLCKHPYVRLHKDSNDRLVLRHHVNVLVVFVVIFICVLVAMSCGLPSVSFETLGLVGVLQQFGGNNKTEFSIFDMVKVLLMDFWLMDSPHIYFGHFLLSALLIIFVFVVPLLQTIGLMYVWFFKLTLKRKLYLLELIELLRVWNYTEIFFTAVLVVAWQLESYSDIFLDGLCGADSTMLRGFVHYGLLDEENAYCFRRVAHMEPGLYLMIPCIVLLFLFNLFVTMAAKQYLRETEDTEIMKSKPPNIPEQNLSYKLDPFPVLFTDAFRWTLCHEFELWASEWHRPDFFVDDDDEDDDIE